MKIVQIIIILLFSLLVETVSACTLTMGYRTNERLPLINKKPYNTGLYQHLYSLAAKNIGCQLIVERGPKKRILKKLKLGKIDFYPGFNFTEKRAKTTFYIENGLPGGNVGISLLTFNTVTNLEQLKGYTLLISLGTNVLTKGIKDINYHKVNEMTVDRAIKLIRKKRGDFYIYNKSSLEYYLNKNKIVDMKLHHDCCGGIKSLYLGFSKKSSHYQQQVNSAYDKTKALSVNNFPVTLSETSIAYKFQSALKALKENGKTGELYAQYYK